MEDFSLPIASFMLISLLATSSIAAASECYPNVAPHTTDNKTYLVMTIKTEPYFRESGGCITGFIPDLMKSMSEFLNIKFELKTSPDNKIGIKEADGSFNGLAGEILNRHADVAAGPMRLNSVAERVLDFSFPYMNSAFVILYKRPSADTPLPFHGAEDLLDSDISIGAVRDGNVHLFLRTSSRDTFRSLYRAIERQGNWFGSLSEGIKRVQNGNFALIVEKDLALYAAMRPPCDVIIVGENLIDFGYSLAMPIGSDVQHLINLALLTLKEEGKIEKIYDKYWQKKCRGPIRFNSASIMHNSGIAGLALILLIVKLI